MERIPMKRYLRQNFLFKEEHFTETADDEVSPLHYAILNGRLSLLKEQLSDPAISIETTNKHGETPLLAALRITDAEVGKEVVKLLLDAGADVNAPDSERDTPLHEVATFFLNQPSRREMFQLITAHPSLDVDKRNMFGETALHVVATSEAAEELAKLGADLEAKDNSGCTPLHHRAPNAEICEMLISSGVELNVCNNQGCTPLSMAVASNNEASVLLLLAAGADANLSVSCNTQIPLRLAYRCRVDASIIDHLWQHTSLVNLLVVAGASASSFQAVLDMWRNSVTGHDETVKFLQEIGHFLIRSPSCEKLIYGKAVLEYVLEQMSGFSLDEAAGFADFFGQCLGKPLLNFAVKVRDFSNGATTEAQMGSRVAELLTYNCGMDCSDLEIFYLEYGDCGLLRLALRVEHTSKVRTLEKLPLFLRIFLDLSKDLTEEIRRIHVSNTDTLSLFNVHNLARHCTVPLGVVKEFEAAYQNMKDYQVPSLVGKGVEETLVELKKNRVPSLLELSRNAARVQLHKKYRVTQICAMVNILHELGVCRRLRQLILMEVPLHDHIQKPRYYPSNRHLYLL